MAYMASSHELPTTLPSDQALTVMDGHPMVLDAVLPSSVCPPLDVAACYPAYADGFTAWEQYGISASPSTYDHTAVNQFVSEQGLGLSPLGRRSCPRKQGMVLPGPLATGTAERCPKCSQKTLHKGDNFFGQRPPSDSEIETIGYTPDDFIRDHGRQCSWTLFRNRCPCSTEWFWTYMIHKESFEGSAFESRVNSPSKKRRRCPTLEVTRDATFRRHQHSYSSGTTTSPFSASSSFEMPNYTSSDDGQGSVNASFPGRHLSLNPSRGRQHQVSMSRVQSHVSSGSTAATSPSMNSANSPDAAEGTPADQLKEPRRRFLKDNWKYKFHHQYGACDSCRAKRGGCAPEHLDEAILRSVPDEVWRERSPSGWRPHWVKQVDDGGS